MFIRKLQREVAVVAIAACAPLVLGCASTNRYVVDPDLSSSAVIEAYQVYRDRTTFDADAGAIDPASMTITGISVSGEPVTVPLAKVHRLYVRENTPDRDRFDAKPDALVDGAGWRADGQLQYVALQTGEIVDVREIPTVVDPEQRVVRCTPVEGAAFVYPFDDILYVQIRNGHPLGTVFFVLGSALLIAGAVAAASWGPIFMPSN